MPSIFPAAAAWMSTSQNADGGGKMKILNLGSMNLDYVYTMDHIVQPGETQSSSEMNIFLGGKGMNQSVALAKAGAEVYQGGMIGNDGQIFLEACRQYGVRPDYIRTADGKSGHAIIQIDKEGQNSILLFGGANQLLTEEYVDDVLGHFNAGDLLLLQNEVNLLGYITDRAYEKGMRIVLNPSPFNEKLNKVDMAKISIFMINEIEGMEMTGKEAPDEILEELLKRYPNAAFVLTLGSAGAVYCDAREKHFQPAFPVKAVDTTAAGDTFTGYFLAGLLEGLPIEQILEQSAKASSITVSRQGAVPSIPYRWEL